MSPFPLGFAGNLKLEYFNLNTSQSDVNVPLVLLISVGFPSHWAYLGTDVKMKRMPSLSAVIHVYHSGDFDVMLKL